MAFQDAPRRVPAAAVVLAPVAVLLTLGPEAPERMQRALAAGPGMTFGEVLADLSAVIATVTAAWLLLATAATLGLTVLAPGSVWLRRTRRISPSAWNRVIAVALGAGLAAIPVAAQAQQTDGAADGAGAPSRSAGLSGLPFPDRPEGQDRSRRLSPQRSPATVVRAGDCLWSIVARGLAPGAADAQVAAEVSRWYRANRDRIGADPDLLHPGMLLHPPLPPDERKTR